MGNSCCACCRSFSSSADSSAPVKIDCKELFAHINDPAELNPLIEYVGDLLSSIKKARESIKINSKLHDVVNSSIEGASKLMEAISTHADALSKDISASKLSRLPPEMMNVISGTLTEIGKLHWIAVGFSVIALVLKTIEQVSEVSEKSVHLLEIMFDLSKRLQILYEQMPNEEEQLKKATCVIVEGIIFCLCCRKRGNFFKYLFASIDEANLRDIEKAIDEIYRELSLMLSMDTRAQIPSRYFPSQYEAPPGTVGIEKKVEEVIQLLDMDGKEPDQARAVILYGFGGIGKTTLAKCVLPRLDLRGFKHCKVELDEKRQDLERYQEQLCEGLTKEKKTFDNYSDGQQKLKEVLQKTSSRYFIFIDNVLREEQINKLLPTELSLPSSSMLRLLITSRQRETVIPALQYGPRRIRCKDYRVEELPEDAAKSYFREIVKESNKITSALRVRHISWDQIDEVAKACHGVPLLLAVYARYLADNGDDSKIIAETIEALQKGDFQRDDTETLLYVFRKLKEEEQDAFIDICTYFHGWQRQEVSCIFGARELKALENGSLIGINESMKVVVHDVLRALGIKEGSKTRIRSLSDFETAQRKTLHGMKGMWIPDDGDPNMVTKLEDHHLTAMNDSLRVLAVEMQIRLISASDVSFPQLTYFQAVCSDELPILRGMHALKYLKITTEDDIEPASSLKLLQNMEKLGNLQKFAFHCSSLQTFPPKFRLAASLIELDLEDCRSLKTLPNGLCNFSALQSLNLRCCERLEALPNDFGNLRALQSLNLDGCERLEALPNDFGNLSALQSLDLFECDRLEALPNDFGNLSALQSLDLCSCESLEALPNDFGNLSALQSLDLSSCGSLEALPNDFGNLSALQSLDLFECERLEALPNDFGNLSALQSLDLSTCRRLEALPNDFGNLNALQSLDLSSCGRLEALPNDFGNLSALQSLDLSFCRRLEALPNDFGNLSALEMLKLNWCETLKALPNDFGKLTRLRSLYSRGCKSLEALPSSFGNLSALESLDLRGCEKLKSLPDGFQELNSLRELYLEWEIVENVPNQFSKFKNL